MLSFPQVAGRESRHDRESAVGRGEPGAESVSGGRRSFPDGFHCKVAQLHRIEYAGFGEGDDMFGDNSRYRVVSIR